MNIMSGRLILEYVENYYVDADVDNLYLIEVWQTLRFNKSYLIDVQNTLRHSKCLNAYAYFT